MSTIRNLAMAPEAPYLKFKEDYTTNEHLVGLHRDLMSVGQVNVVGFQAIHQDLRRAAEVNAAGLDSVSQGLTGVSQGLEHVAGQIQDVGWAIEQGFTEMARTQAQVAQVTREGFQSLSNTFHWGLARIAHEMELDREVYQDIRRGILYPSATQGLEFRERAETALENGWWEDAVRDLERAVAENPIDFLAHYHLGHVLWFRYGQWQAALDEFAAAARYADTKKAEGNQKYYAALAYVHLSLLWRMRAETEPADADAANRRGYAASRRAVELKPDFMIARLEHALNCMRAGVAEEAFRLIDEDARLDKRRLSAYLMNPDLKAWPAINARVEQSRSSIESVDEERVRLHEEQKEEKARLQREARARAEVKRTRRAEEERRRQVEHTRSVEEERQQRVERTRRAEEQRREAARLALQEKCEQHRRRIVSLKRFRLQTAGGTLAFGLAINAITYTTGFFGIVFAFTLAAVVGAMTFLVSQSCEIRELEKRLAEPEVAEHSS